MVASYEYDPYGKVLSAAGTMATANPLRYRGYYYDSELEMYYLQSRYYDPNTGRFINADDISMLDASGTVLGYNLFAYCENNPANNVDQTGMAAINAVFAAMGVIAGWHLGDYIARSLGYRPDKGSFGKRALYWTIRAGFVVGSGVVGWFAASALTALLKSFIFSNPNLIAITPIWVYKFLGIGTGANSVVLGKYPLYESLANKLGSTIFKVAKSVWDSMTSTQQWAANSAFLDKIITQGLKITLQTNAYSNRVTGFFAKEIAYLLEHGYKIIEGGWAMVPK